MNHNRFLLWITAPAFVFILLAGLVIAGLTLRDIPATDWKAMAAPEKILSGASTKQLIQLLNQHFVLSHSFSEIEHGILWNLTGDLGPRVRAGCGDWLFLTDELELHPQRKSDAAFRVSIAARVDKLLAPRGIKLAVVIVPDKTRIESAHLCGLHRPQQFASRIADWQTALQQQGMEVRDLTPVLAGMTGDRYYHTDTHWNEAGANAAAADLANWLRTLQWAGSGGEDEVVLSTHPVARSGDLIHLAGLDGLPSWLRPKTELTPVTEVVPVATAGDDLFGDASLPTTALIGTSYSRNSNFVPFLEHHLGEQVANLAKDGGDFSGAAIAYFASATFRNTPPKLVIWEIPERVIEMPLKQTERDWLQQLERSGLQAKH